MWASRGPPVVTTGTDRGSCAGSHPLALAFGLLTVLLGTASLASPPARATARPGGGGGMLDFDQCPNWGKNQTWDSSSFGGVNGDTIAAGLQHNRNFWLLDDHGRPDGGLRIQGSELLKNDGWAFHDQGVAFDRVRVVAWALPRHRRLVPGPERHPDRRLGRVDGPRDIDPPPGRDVRLHPRWGYVGEDSFSYQYFVPIAVPLINSCLPNPFTNAGTIPPEYRWARVRLQVRPRPVSTVTAVVDIPEATQDTSLSIPSAQLLSYDAGSFDIWMVSGDGNFTDPTFGRPSSMRTSLGTLPDGDISGIELAPDSSEFWSQTVRLRGYVTDRDPGFSGSLFVIWGDGTSTQIAPYPCLPGQVEIAACHETVWFVPTWNGAIESNGRMYFDLSHVYAGGLAGIPDIYRIVVGAGDETGLADPNGAVAMATVCNGRPPPSRGTVEGEAAARVGARGNAGTWERMRFHSRGRTWSHRDCLDHKQSSAYRVYPRPVAQSSLRNSERVSPACSMIARNVPCGRSRRFGTITSHVLPLASVRYNAVWLPLPRLGA